MLASSSSTASAVDSRAKSSKPPEKSKKDSALEVREFGVSRNVMLSSARVIEPVNMTFSNHSTSSKEERFKLPDPVIWLLPA